MKKTYTFLLALLIAGFAMAQVAPVRTMRPYKVQKPTFRDGKQIEQPMTVIPEYNLKGIKATFFTEGFESGDLAGWNNVDQDGDSYFWEAYDWQPHSGTYHAMSFSWYSGSVLTPENWLISPAIDLGTATGTVTLKWYIGATDPDWEEESYSVYISTTGNTPGDFGVATFAEQLPNSGSDQYYERTLNVSSYTGQTIYIAFVHENSSDWYTIKLDDIEVFENTVDDAAVVGIVAPNNDASCVLGAAEDVTVSILNNGGSDITGFPVSYSVNGGGTITETVSATITPAQVYSYTFTQTLDLSTLGYYFVTASVALPGDANAANNSFTEEVRSTDGVLTVWGHTSGNSTMTWHVLNSAGDTVVQHGGYMWDIDVSEDFCLLDDDCYTFEFLTNGDAGMDATGYLVLEFNGVQVGGTTTPGQQTTDFTVPYIGGGCAPMEDAGVIAISSPSNCANTATEQVTITIKNLGNVDLTGIPVAYTLNGGTPVTATVGTTLTAGATYDYTFAGTIDMSSPANYTIEAYTDLTGDFNPANDGMEVTLTGGADATITIDLLTDAYPSETSWELFNSSGGIVAFGTETDYAEETAYSIDVCAISTDCYSFSIYDSYGDGIGGYSGSPAGSLTVSYEGVSAGGFTTTDADFGTQFDIFSIGAGCVANDLLIAEINTPAYVEPGNVNIIGTVKNVGTNDVTSFNVTYTVDGGAPSPVYSATGVTIAIGEEYVFTHNVPANLVSLGYYDIEVTIGNVNGTTDGNINNNVLEKTVKVVPTAPVKRVFGEEATGTWGGWCIRGHVYMEYMATTYPDTWIGVAVHNGDPMVVTAYDAAIGGYIGGYPSGLVDRDEGTEYDPTQFEAAYELMINNVPPVALDIVNVSWNAGTRLVSYDVEATFVDNITADLRFNGIISENEVTGTAAGWEQANYYSGGANGPMGGYENLADPVP
ncbi:MAG: choice-of-anchor J domain-containing protein, partial [Bacteroidetes bacterium]|nr:choice-of-anchor J domain-containing protein [Bacteroidota bacterium]